MLVSLLYKITDLGDSAITGAVALTFGIYFWIMHQRRASYAIVGAFLISSTIIALAKITLYTNCGSPLEGPFNIRSPSGHTAVSVAVYGMLATIISSSLPPKQRVIPYLVAVPLIILIAYSRILVGHHTGADVVVGSLVGLLTTFVLWRFTLKDQNISCHWWPIMVFTFVLIILLHGLRLPAEEMLDWLSTMIKGLLHNC